MRYDKTQMTAMLEDLNALFIFQFNPLIIVLIWMPSLSLSIIYKYNAQHIDFIDHSYVSFDYFFRILCRFC